MARTGPAASHDVAMTGTQTDLKDDVRTELSNNDGDHERFAHYVGARGRSAEAIVMEARVMGIAIEALCGKKWVPSRDPKRYPVCPTCAELAMGMRGAS